MPDSITRTSKFLSFVLRHKPEAIGLTLDDTGWVEVDELITRANANGEKLTRELIERVVAENDKKRFTLSEDGKRIRAAQGHSVYVELGLSPKEPPEILYHGTATRFLDSIRAKGLIAGSRQHVHLSRDEATATKVGQRHGKPVVLRITAGEMLRAGNKFYLSENGVWLTESVPVEFIEFQ